MGLAFTLRLPEQVENKIGQPRKREDQISHPVPPKSNL